MGEEKYSPVLRTVRADNKQIGKTSRDAEDCLEGTQIHPMDKQVPPGTHSQENNSIFAWNATDQFFSSHFSFQTIYFQFAENFSEICSYSIKLSEARI